MSILIVLAASALLYAVAAYGPVVDLTNRGAHAMRRLRDAE